MKGKGSKAPSPPDPNVQAAAQASANRETALANAAMNRVNQVTPYGTLKYTQTQGLTAEDALREAYKRALGVENLNQDDLNQRIKTAQRTDEGRKSIQDQISEIYNTEGARQRAAQGLFNPQDRPIYSEYPTYTSTVELTPEQQQLLNQQNQLSGSLNQLAIDQTGRIKNLLGQPLNINNEATEARLNELGRKRLDPRFAEQEQTLRTRLANQGFAQGSEAYNRQLRDLEQSKNDAYNNLLLTGRQQAIQEALTERNQPINEISALMGAGQVTLPQFSSVPQVNVQGVDVAGIQNQAYQNRLAATQLNNQRNTGLMSGLFNLGSAALGGWAGGGFR